jgi:hypothetical protein
LPPAARKQAARGGGCYRRIKERDIPGKPAGKKIGPERLIMKKKRIWILCGITGGLVLVAAAAVVVPAVRSWLQAPLVWYVEEGYEKTWVDILGERAGKKEAPQYGRVKTWRAGDQPGAGESGFIITTNLSGTQPDEDPPEAGRVVVYHQLSRNTALGSARLLAVDPWLVFRDQDDPGLSLRRVSSVEGGEGNLFLPGKEKRAVAAWLAQFVMEEPGVFPTDEAVWKKAESALFAGRRFQQDAATFSWNDVWFYFNRRKPAWMYAPVSWIRSFPGYDTDRITAAVFPNLQGGDEFGLEANLLWAVPFGRDKDRSGLDAVSAWLYQAETQTHIADTLGWIPAHREGKPFNYLVYSAQTAWLRSSFIWQFREERGNQDIEAILY